MSIPRWKRVWNVAKGLLPTEGLAALREALEKDDTTLLQGATTSPPPLKSCEDWPLDGACALTYCFWKGGKAETVGEGEEAFARVCYDIDQLLGEPSGCRYFLNWFDETPREEMRKALLEEVVKELWDRAVKECAVS